MKLKSKGLQSFEFKSAAVSESEDKTRGLVEGYVAIFHNLDEGYDIIEPGAFKKTLREQKGIIKLLLDHDQTKPAGHSTEAYEDDKGLFMKMELVLIHPEVRHRFELIKQAHELKTKVGMSIGYRTIKAEPDKDRPIIRRLKELHLGEGSFVTFPMNPLAGTTGAKFELNAAQHEELIGMLKKAGYSAQEIFAALGKSASDQGDGGAADPVIDPGVAQSLADLKRTFGI